MFNSKKTQLDLEYRLRKEIDDLKRALQYEGWQRLKDLKIVEMQEWEKAKGKRLVQIEARYKAEGEAIRGKVAEEYATKFLDLAHKLTNDFANASAKLMEKVLEVVKEFKPLQPQLNVLPTTTNINHPEVIKS